jgi:hypothetical protein
MTGTCQRRELRPRSFVVPVRLDMIKTMTNLRVLFIAVAINTVITLGLLRWHEASLLEKISSPQAAAPVQVQIDQITPEQRAARREEITRQVRALTERFIAEAKLDTTRALRMRQISEKYILEAVLLNDSGAAASEIAKKASDLQAATNREVEGIVSPEQYLIFLRLLNPSQETQ